MTLKNSFWANCRENHKRRIWVWFVAVLSQLLAYGGMTMIYFSRIQNFYAEGVYKTKELYQDALWQAGKDALGFSDNIYGIIFLLGALIAMQGFSYLYDRRKVDLYHSVPVTKGRRFAVVYINGIIIYLTANLSGLLLGMVIAVSQGAVNGEVIAAAGLAFLWNLFFFLTAYHMMILAVMLTGNRFVTICVFLMFALYEVVVRLLISDMKEIFFRSYSSSIYFLDDASKLSPVYDCAYHIWSLKNAKDTAAAAGIAFPVIGKWLLIAVALLVLAWFAYRQRPSEAAGKAVAFAFLKPILKVMVAIPAALLAGRLVYAASYENEMLQVLGMLVGGVLCCAAMEVLYEFDIRCLFKHLLSSGIALAGILAVFCIFKWDLLGYDTYVPAQNKVKSIAFLADGYYDSYWDEDFQYINEARYLKDHMFVTDTEPVLTLARSFLQADTEKMKDHRTIQVLYRLTSGREVVRQLHVDYADAEAERLLDQILKDEAFKQGLFQAMTDETSYQQATAVSYHSGAANVPIPPEEIMRLREAWIKDMEQFDFTLVRHSLPCGQIQFTIARPQSHYTDYRYGQWVVYDSFENTIACLKKLEAYYPMQLEAADIDNITVTCYHNEMAESEQDMLTYNGAYGNMTRAVAVDGGYTDFSVRETFYDQEQIAQILPHIQASFLEPDWLSWDAMDRNYSVEVVFKKDSTYPYERTSYYFSYDFIAGQVPDFVAEATAYTD